MPPWMFLLAFATGFGSAWSWQGARADARVSALVAAQAAQARQTAEAAADRLRASQAAADALDRAAHQRDLNLNRRLEDARRALKPATDGRRCLGEPALRVLGQSPGLSLADAVPDAAGAVAARPAATAAAAEDEGDSASDTEIADWIARAAALYQGCRGRIGDLRDFFAPHPEHD